MRRVDVAYALILDDTSPKILMVKNKGNASWSLPGGAVEKEETLDQAAIREAKEETGLDVKVQGIIAINECIFEKKQEHAIFFTFRAEVIGGSLELVRPHEISEVAWMDVDKAGELMPYFKDGIRSLVEGNEIPYYDQGRK
ncbi:NUDIX hydrolase [Paenibacillus sp. P13VS]|uniref:NUDIX hydrolase n=1 Tax=Paenibacillus sp. P13VS TaxID=2697367 RepID=UPI00187BC1CF|nr:NUDIX hydrolase [Paenibacillus sp. P13VS]MBE7680757.1 NUDIX domain-containing protein [Paenibacillus sp. P13VS]